VHAETPIDSKRIGGTLTSIRAVRRRVGPDNRSNFLERDDRRRIYCIEPPLLEGLKRAFDLAEGAAWHDGFNSRFSACSLTSGVL
jgi:hypothetical protein